IYTSTFLFFIGITNESIYQLNHKTFKKINILPYTGKKIFKTVDTFTKIRIQNLSINFALSKYPCNVAKCNKNFVSI
ncbi:hypothetical protein BpHYR1_010882, partial [Brachionus plicatilis]